MNYLKRLILAGALVLIALVIGIVSLRNISTRTANISSSDSPAPVEESLADASRRLGQAEFSPEEQEPTEVQPSYGAEPAFADAKIVVQEESVPDYSNRFTRKKLIETDFKYPLVLVEETVRRDLSTGTEEILRRTEMVADHVMVKLEQGATEEQLAEMAARHGGSIRKKMFAPQMYLVQLSQPTIDSVADAITLFQREVEIIALAEPDFIVHAIATIPNDAQFTDLWGMNNTGQSGGTADADIDAPEAWDILTGSTNVLVGVIDTGFNYNHEDLAANAWSNPGETGLDGEGNDKKTNDIDDDDNGFVDDWRGWDFVNDDNDPMDDHSHGSHCSGTIGGVGNNLVGVAGVNWSVSIVGLKFLSSGGSGSTSDAVDATYYGTRIGVKLTSNSWGGGGFSQSMFDAVEDARLNDILFIAAAGNSASDNDEFPHYPSSLTNDNVIAVAATDHNDALASFSCYGATSVDLGAPGVNILSTVLGDNYDSYNGTSMATPHVSGLAALIWSGNPSLSYQEVINIINAGLEPIPALDGITVTGGRINAYNSVLLLGMLVTTSTPEEGAVVFSQPTDFVINFSDAYDASTVSAGDLSVNSNVANSVVLTDGDTLTFSFLTTPVTNEGLQTMHIAEDAITRTSDDDGVKEWIANFRYDVVPLTITGTVPTDASVVLLPMTSLVVQVNEPLGTNSVGLDDLSINQGSVVDARVIDSNTVEYVLSDIIYESTLTVDIGAGKLTDVYGNPSIAYSGSLILDVETQAFVGAINPGRPLGSLLYQGSVDAFINPAGDNDSFTIELDDNQTIAAVVLPEEGLRPTVALYDPSSSLLGTTTGWATNEPAFLQATDTTGAGAYTLSVSGAGGGSGGYSLRVYLNCVVEDETYTAATNDTLASAQLLEPNFIALVSNATAAVVAGSVGNEGVTTIFLEDFESGLNGFTVSNDVGSGSGMWHLSGGRATNEGHSATSSIYYGESETAEGGGDYDNGAANGGAIYSPAISLPDVSALMLTFAYFLETEGSASYDIASVSVDDGAGFTEVLSSGSGSLPTGSGGVWVTVEADLTAYAGKDVVLEFAFETIDSIANDYEGWYVDDITITTPIYADDWYFFFSGAGDSASLALRQLGAGEVDMNLYNIAGELIAASTENADNVDEAIEHYVSAGDSFLYAHIAGYDADYTLVVTRNAAFDLEPNSEIDEALDIAGRNIALGVIRESGALFGIDWHNPTPTDILSLNPETGESEAEFPSPETPTTNPFGFNAAYDGTHVWYNDGAFFGNNSIYKIDATSGAVVDSFSPGVPVLHGLAWMDGEIFATDSSAVYVFDDSTYVLQRTLNPSWSGISGLAGDAAEGVLWGISQDHTIYKVDPLTGNVLDSGSVDSEGFEQGMAVAGDELFVSETTGQGALNEIAVYDASTFAAVRRMTAPVDDMISGLGGDGAGGGSDDWYSFNVNAGDSLVLTTYTPAGDPQEPYEIHNVLNPSLELYDSTGTLISSNDNAATDGKNATISHTATLTGSYKAHVHGEEESEGEYILLVAGSSGGLDTFEVTETDPLDGSVLSYAPTEMAITFNDTILLSTLDASDLSVGGASATGVTVVEGNTLLFDLPALAEGTQVVSMAAGALSDIQSTLLEAYTGEIVIDETPPAVTASSTTDGDTLSEGPLTWTIVFSEPIDEANVDAADVLLEGALSGSVDADAIAYTAATHTLTVVYTNLVDDSYTLTLVSGDGAFEDSAGNDLDGSPSWPLPSGDGAMGDDFLAHFYVDIGTNSYPTPFELKEPEGSLIYDPDVSGYIGVGDSDTYTLLLDGAQLLTVVVEPDSDLRPSVQVVGSGGSLGSATAASAGDDAVLQTISISATGAYDVVISGASSSTGTYTARVLLNAAVEEEMQGGPSNDVISAAQDLDASFLEITNGMFRGAAIGTTDGSSFGCLGPDGRGNQACVADYDFEDIAVTGAAILEDEDDAYYGLNFPAGFSFEFYGEGRTNIFINSNGLLTFESGNSGYVNTDLSSSPNQPCVAVFWDDLVVEGGVDSKVCWEVRGSGDDERLIIQWNDIRFFGGGGLGQITFQAILYEDDDTIQVNFEDLDTGASGADGASATVGMKDVGSQGTNRLAVSYNAGPNEYVDTGITLEMGPSVGSADTDDYYSFSLLEDNRIAVLVTALDGGDLDVELYDAAASLQASGQDRFENIDPVIETFTAPADGTYYIRVSGGQSVDYSVVALLDGSFDYEPNNSGTNGVDIRLTGATLGALPGPGTSSDGDFYTFHLNSGQGVTLETGTPGDQPYEFQNTLDPAIQLFSPSGLPVAADDNSSGDGRNARLTYAAPAGGLYAVRVYASSGNGPYMLAADLPSQPPLIRYIGNQVADIGSVLEFDVFADEPDGDTVTLAMVNGPPNASFSPSGSSGSFSFAPIDSQSGTVYNVSFTATDTDGTDTNTIAIEVIDSGQGPLNLFMNPGFEDPAGTTDYASSYWTAWGLAHREGWAARSGERGSYFEGWTAPNGAGLYQDVNVTTGTYTYALWMRKEPGFNPTLLDIKLEWFNASHAQIQSPTTVSLMNLPGDAEWHHVFVSGTCNNGTLSYVRPVLASDWVAPNPGNSSLMFDDAELYAGEYAGKKSLANGGFEDPPSGTESWRGTQWYAISESLSKGHEIWAGRTGAGGAALFGWDQGSPSFDTTIGQNLTPGTGTCIFSVWMLREPNFLMTNTELRIQWYDDSYTNKVQDDTVHQVTIPNDNSWHSVGITGTCTKVDLFEVRLKVISEWLRNTTNVDNRAVKIDDASYQFIDHSWDTDMDGLPDWWELINFNTMTGAVASLDSDTDGIDNLGEFLSGTKPKDASSLLKFMSDQVGGAGYIIYWQSVTDKFYRINRSTNLISGFAPLRINIPATPPENVYTDTTGEAMSIYQVEVEGL